MSEARQLAAIVFIDIAGFSSIMSEDEEKGKSLVKQFRTEVKPIVEEHEGIWHKELGDGALCSFKSARNSVLCCTKIQQSKSNNYNLKIGIHLGDIIIEDSDILGDGVNIASRLQSLTLPGSICVSESIYKPLKNNTDLQFKKNGSRKLKNIEQPVKTFLVKAEGLSSKSLGSKINYGRVFLIALGLIASFVAGYLFNGNSSNSDQSSITKLDIKLPEDKPLEFIGSSPLGMGRPNLALSPDGSTLVYLSTENGIPYLFKRNLDSYETILLKGTKDAYNPTFSPDGNYIGYFSNGSLKVIDADGEEDKVLGSIINPYGMAWLEDGSIIVSNNEGTRLLSFNSNEIDITPTIIGKKFSFSDYLWPSVIGKEKYFITGSYRKQAYLVNASNHEIHNIPGIFSEFLKYIPSGHLIFVNNDDLYAVKFDNVEGKITGSPKKVIDDIRIETHFVPQLTFSNDGTMIYATGEPVVKAEFVILGRNGKEESLDLPAEQYGTFLFNSRKDKIITCLLWNEEEMVFIDLDRKIFRPNLFKSQINSGGFAVSDDEETIYNVEFTDSLNHLIKMSTVSGSSEVILSNRNLGTVSDIHSVSEDLLIVSFDRDYNTSIYALELDNPSEMKPVSRTPAHEWGPRFSPDGKYIAFTSDETGQYEIYVKEYPVTEKKWQISTRGGEEPIWINDEKIIYRNGNNWNTVDLEISDTIFNIKTPEIAFSGPYLNPAGHSYDVLDEDHILVLKPIDPRINTTSLRIIKNWFKELE